MANILSQSTTTKIRDIIGLTGERNKERLCAYLTTLPYPDLLEVEAVMLLGRGDYDDYDEAIKAMQKLYGTYGDNNMAVSYIMGKAPLGRYLEDGLKSLCA